jgi:peptide/nickel transport system permease protein
VLTSRAAISRTTAGTIETIGTKNLTLRSPPLKGRFQSRLSDWFRVAARFSRQRPLGALGALIVAVMIIAALLADFIAPFDPLANDYGSMLQAPNAKHWFGTDSFGRDVLSRILYGSRTALWIGFAAALLAASLGAWLGLVSAYFGGRTDLIMQRFMDLLLSFPLIILALVVVAVLGAGTTNVILAIMVPMVPRCALVVRSSALALREMPFVEAGRALGFGPLRIILRHLLPNVMAPFLIMLTAFLGQAILLEASLSFLGLGVAEPQPAWGLMLRGAAVDFAERAPWMAIYPGAAISLSVFAFNLLGDSLRDALDPKLRL